MENPKETVLVVDDDTGIRSILNTRLCLMGYVVILASDGEEALLIYKRKMLNLIILDVMLPKINGYLLCQEIRRESDVPIIMLTSLDDTADRVTGFELGVDDYITKPFSPKELEARIKVVVKRFTQSAHILEHHTSGCLCIGNIRIDLNKRQVYKRNEKVRLTGMEFNLLELLVGGSGESFSRASILQEVWGYKSERHIDTRVVDVHISRLRYKLESDPGNPDLILTARGTGYLFQKIAKVLT